MQKKTYKIEGLSCSNCADKIERAINKIENVEAHIDFLQQKLSIIVSEGQAIKTYEHEIDKIISSMEPQAIRVPDEQAKNDQKVSQHQKIIYQLIVSIFFVSIAFFAVGNESYKLVFLIIAYVIIGYDVIIKGISFKQKSHLFDEHFLMMIATMGAFIIGEYYEAVAVLMFYKVGLFFQELAVFRAKKSIKALISLKPDQAHFMIDGQIMDMHPSKVRMGSHILVKVGEKIPLDGILIKGHALCDAKAITGESLPLNISIGQQVHSGTINLAESIIIETTHTFENSTIHKMIELIESAGQNKAKTEQFITKFARYYTPVVVVSALLLSIIPPLLFGLSFQVWLYRALIFLVISCPCALVLSIPLSYFGGIGSASKRGILIKGSAFLETLTQIDAIVFDKTGTLTKGDMHVVSINAIEGFDENLVLAYAAYAESQSNHPIAKSILKAYDKPINQQDIKMYKEHQGLGIFMKYNTLDICVGRNVFFDEQKINYPTFNDARLTILVSVNASYVGHIILEDEIKEHASDAIKKLSQLGIKHMYILSGDKKEIVDYVGQSLGIKQTYAQLLPNDKVNILKALKKKHKNIACVGDGINDAPLLAMSDVSFSMGGLGSDAAIEASDIVIMNDDLNKISESIKIAQRTKSIVWQNIIIALSVKLLFLSLGAFGIASLWEAVFADVGVAIIAIFNAMRILYKKH